MTKFEQLDAMSRENLFAFALIFFQVVAGPNRQFRRARHVEAICFALERAARGETKRLIITVPPRYLKSYTVAIAFVAWMLGKDPGLKFMIASYGADLAEEHARGFRLIADHPDFNRLFPRFVIDRNTADELTLTGGGGRKAISVGGAATGHGADILIIDDLLKAGDARSELLRAKANDFFDITLYSRLNIKAEGVIIVIQQRLHEDDLVGHLLEQGGWTHINMPAIADKDVSYPLYRGRSFVREAGDLLAPELEGHTELDEARRRLGETDFNAQYLLDPVPPDGNTVQMEWFGRYHDPLERYEYDCVVQSWDTAYSNDPDAAYSVCLTFGADHGTWDLLDVMRARLNYTELIREAKRLHRHWRPDRVLVEHAVRRQNIWH